MTPDQETQLKIIKGRIDYKYSILQNLRKEMKRKAVALAEIEEDIKRLERMKECMNISTTSR
jgi:hypothetical protein